MGRWQSIFAICLGLGEDVAYCQLSALRHLRKVSGTGDDGGLYSFELEDGCQMQVNGDFSALWKHSPNLVVSCKI